jgi:hypothetical protein
MQESWEEWRREGKLAKSTMEEREAHFMAVPRRKKGYLYPPPKSDRYSHLHRLKPDLTLAIAGLKSPALARNNRTNSRLATEGFSPQILGSPAKAGPQTGSG